MNDSETSSGQILRLTLSVEEVAQLLGLSRSAVYEAIARGDIPALRFGRRITSRTLSRSFSERAGIGHANALSVRGRLGQRARRPTLPGDSSRREPEAKTATTTPPGSRYWGSGRRPVPRRSMNTISTISNTPVASRTMGTPIVSPKYCAADIGR